MLRLLTAVLSLLIAFVATGAGANDGYEVSYTANSFDFEYGDRTGFSGLVRNARTKDPAIGVLVRVEQDPYPFEGDWSPAGRDVTDENGNFVISVRPEKTTRYRASDVEGTQPTNSEFYTALAEIEIRPNQRATCEAGPPRGRSLG